MTKSQKLTVRASEIRQRLNEIAGLEGDALTDEVRAEEATLTTEYRDTEVRLRAATIAEGDPAETRETRETPEQRERTELRESVAPASVRSRGDPGPRSGRCRGRVRRGARLSGAGSAGHVRPDRRRNARPSIARSPPRRPTAT